MLILVRIHRKEALLEAGKYVVNCFQNANFSEDSQVFNPNACNDLVVNCFQNANFSEDSQDTRRKKLVSCFLWDVLGFKKVR